MSLTRHRLPEELHKDFSSSKCNEQRVWQWVWLVHVTNWRKQLEWWLFSPSIPKDSQSHIPVAQQDTHPPGWGSAPSPQLPRAAEAGGAAVPAPSACKGPRAPGPGLRQLQKNLRVQRAHSLGLSSRECTHLSQGCSCGSSGLQPVLYLLQINQFVCTENSPAGAVLRL